MSDEKIERFIVGIELDDGLIRVQAYIVRPRGTSYTSVLDQMMTVAEQVSRDKNLRLLPFVLVTGPLTPETASIIEAELSGVDPKIATTIAAATDYHTTVWLSEPGLPTHESVWGLH